MTRIGVLEPHAPSPNLLLGGTGGWESHSPDRRQLQELVLEEKPEKGLEGPAAEFRAARGYPPPFLPHRSTSFIPFCRNPALAPRPDLEASQKPRRDPGGPGEEWASRGRVRKRQPLPNAAADGIPAA